MGGERGGEARRERQVLPGRQQAVPQLRDGATRRGHHGGAQDRERREDHRVPGAGAAPRQRARRRRRNRQVRMVRRVRGRRGRSGGPRFREEQRDKARRTQARRRRAPFPAAVPLHECHAGQGRRERRGAHRAVPRADGPAGVCPGRVFAVLPQQPQLRQRRGQAGESTVVRRVEQGYEHEDPPRVRGQLQVLQAAADASFRIIRSDLEAEEAVTSGSRHVPYASCRDRADRARQVQSSAGVIQQLQDGTA